MAVQWGLAGDGFNAMEALNAAGATPQARQQRVLFQRQVYALDQEQNKVAARQRATQQLSQGDEAGATQTALGAGDNEFTTYLHGLHEDHRKDTLEGFKQLGQYALLADTPAKWDAYVDDFAKQGHPEAAAYKGQFGMREQILARAGLANEYQKSQQVDYKVIPPGGYLQGFNAQGAPLGGAQAATAPQAAPSDDLEAHAAAAIAAGADPAAVHARLAQMRGGAPSQGGATFP